MTFCQSETVSLSVRTYRMIVSLWCALFVRNLGCDFSEEIDRSVVCMINSGSVDIGLALHIATPVSSKGRQA